MSTPWKLVRATVGTFSILISASACATHAPPPPADQAAESDERIRRVQAGLLTYHQVRGQEATYRIEDRMRFHNVPGVSVAVIDDGRVSWARGWGETEAGNGTPVDSTTLFQAASISKPVAAAGALRLVDEGALDLDGDVNHRLRSWTVPENDLTRTEKVTLRRLLSHTAGTTVHGFPGYASGSPIPTLVQLLTGTAPANTPAVMVNRAPGSLWRYSGGGTSIVQLLMNDVTDRPFHEFMRERVLEPAGMHRSTFEQPLPETRRAEAATGHRSDGTAIPGRYHTYPEQAAAGLWTTPSDLARFAIEIQRALGGENGRIISPATARAMLTTVAGEYGLGFALRGAADSLWFEHGGANEGFRAQFSALGARGQGVVVMTNGDGGGELAQEILRAVAREYDLPGYRPVLRDVVQVDEQRLARLTGDYVLETDRDSVNPFLRVRLDNGVLLADVPRAGWSRRTLRASSDTTFFFLENPGEIRFLRAAEGGATGVEIAGTGQTIRLVRR